MLSELCKVHSTIYYYTKELCSTFICQNISHKTWIPHIPGKCFLIILLSGLKTVQASRRCQDPVKNHNTILLNKIWWLLEVVLYLLVSLIEDLSWLKCTFYSLCPCHIENVSMWMFQSKHTMSWFVLRPENREGNNHYVLRVGWVTVHSKPS